MVASGAAFSRLREQERKIPIKTKIKLPESVLIGKSFECSVVVENIGGNELKDLDIHLVLPEGGVVSLEENNKRIERLSPGEIREVVFKLQGSKIAHERDSRWFVASRIVVGDKPNFSFDYVKVLQE